MTMKNGQGAACDLHVHSCYSDGSLTPEELIALAQRTGVKAVALCDHNTVSGLSRFETAAEGTGVLAVPGVEITACFQGAEVHVLGLFLRVDVRDALREYLRPLNSAKEENNRSLVWKLQAGGYGISYEEVREKAAPALPNRVHFANVLMEKGYVSSVQEAFRTVLAEDGGFYESRPSEKKDALEAVELLASLGAVPVLAHPLMDLTEAQLRAFLPTAKRRGLVALEAIYPRFSREKRALLEDLAREFGLCISGGSDFHGTNKPDIQMGSGKQNIFVPMELCQALQRAKP